MDKLNEALNQIESGDLYPFHMPGHKRQAMQRVWQNVYSRDITEIEGYDNLHHPEGIIKEEQEFAAKLFGAEESYFLVNGSSCGVLASICAVTETGDFEKDSQCSKILMCRNAHKSAYNALMLSGAKADYLYPREITDVPFAGEISAEDVKNVLETDCYRAVFITSPTYEGVVSDIAGICEAAHSKGVPVIVDEAHGAHLGIWGGNGYFPKSALAQGADVVIQSLHKTLPAMTQTAILHVQGKKIDRQKLRLYLSTFQSSSPSYIMMNSISTCLHDCAEKGEKLIKDYQQRLETFYHRAETLKFIKVYMPNGDITKDPGKIIINATSCGLNGTELSKQLREKYHLEMEMASGEHCIAMTSVMDTDEGFHRLWKALEELDACGKDKEVKNTTLNNVPRIQSVFSIKKALSKPGNLVMLDHCEGKVSKEFIYLYPPGIPLVAPGERISREMLAYVKEAKRLGIQVQGPQDYLCEQIYCVGETS